MQAFKAIGKAVKNPMFKTIGNTIKMPITKTVAGPIENSMSLIRRTKSTIKNVVFGLGEKYLKTGNNVGKRSVKFLGEEGFKRVKGVAPWAFKESKQLIKRQSAYMRGKGS